jgi:hypothetical protein
VLVHPCAAALYPSVSYNCDSVNLVPPPHANRNFGVVVVIYTKVEWDIICLGRMPNFRGEMPSSFSGQ